MMLGVGFFILLPAEEERRPILCLLHWIFVFFRLFLLLVLTSFHQLIIVGPPLLLLALNLDGNQAVYTAGVVLPTPLACCRYYHRSLNPKKLIEVC